MTPESMEVKLARLEEKIDTIIRRLESGDKQFREMDARVKEVEQRIARWMRASKKLSNASTIYGAG